MTHIIETYVCHRLLHVIHYRSAAARLTHIEHHKNPNERLWFMVYVFQTLHSTEITIDWNNTNKSCNRYNGLSCTWLEAFHNHKLLIIRTMFEFNDCLKFFYESVWLELFFWIYSNSFLTAHNWFNVHKFRSVLSTYINIFMVLYKELLTRSDVYRKIHRLYKYTAERAMKIEFDRERNGAWIRARCMSCTYMCFSIDSTAMKSKRS